MEFKTAEAAQQVAAKELKFTDDAAEPLIIKLKYTSRAHADWPPWQQPAPLGPRDTDRLRSRVRS